MEDIVSSTSSRNNKSQRKTFPFGNKINKKIVYQITKITKDQCNKRIFFFMNKMTFSPGTWIRWEFVSWTDYLMMMHTEQTPKYCQIRRESMLFHKPSIVIQYSCPVAKSAQTIYGTYSPINWYGVLEPNNLLFKLSWKLVTARNKYCQLKDTFSLTFSTELMNEYKTEINTLCDKQYCPIELPQSIKIKWQLKESFISQ